MIYRTAIERTFDGQWLARCDNAPDGPAEVLGGSPNEALDGLRREIRRRLGFRPHGVAADRVVQLDVSRTPMPREIGWSGV
jgi:hypothetical protein